MSGASPYSFTWELSSDFGQEKIISADLSRILTDYQVRQARREEIVTAVCEACLNAFEHGNRLNRKRLVEVRMTLTSRSCLVRIYDEGSGFEYAPLPDDPASRRQRSDPRGWGLHFISSFASRVRAGTESGQFYVELLFQLDE